jgi:hypothetical protein
MRASTYACLTGVKPAASCRRSRQFAALLACGLAGGIGCAATDGRGDSILDRKLSVDYPHARSASLQRDPFLPTESEVRPAGSAATADKPAPESTAPPPH